MKRALHVDMHYAHSGTPALILLVAALPMGHPTEPGPGPSHPGLLYSLGVAMLLVEHEDIIAFKPLWKVYLSLYKGPRSSLL
jgi:hypothetical protein